MTLYVRIAKPALASVAGEISGQRALNSGERYIFWRRSGEKIVNKDFSSCLPRIRKSLVLPSDKVSRHNNPQLSRLNNSTSYRARFAECRVQRIEI